LINKSHKNKLTKITFQKQNNKSISNLNKINNTNKVINKHKKPRSRPIVIKTKVTTPTTTIKNPKKELK